MGYWQAAVAKKIDGFATALHLGMTVDDISDLDLSYTPPLGSPWDAVPPLAQSWAKAVRLQPRTWYSVRAAVMRMNLGGLVRCA